MLMQRIQSLPILVFLLERDANATNNEDDLSIIRPAVLPSSTLLGIAT